MSVSPERLEEALALADELVAALDDPERGKWGGYPWEHLGDAERDVRKLLPLAAALREARAENERLRKEKWSERGVMLDLQERAEEAEAEAIFWQAACEESQEREADLISAIRHVVADSPGTPDSVKQFISAALAVSPPADEAKP